MIEIDQAIKDNIKRTKIEWYSSKEVVKKYYDDRFSTPLGYFWDTIEKKIVLEHVKGCVLDAGTGPGRFANPIGEKGHKVIGVDISSRMLSFAKEKSTGNDVFYVRADLESLPFRIENLTK